MRFLVATRYGLVFTFLLVIFRVSLAQTAYDPVVGPVPRIICPANHAMFFAPVDIPIFAYALRTNVEFFAGTNDLGSGFNLGLGSAGGPPRVQPDFVIAGPNPLLGHIFYCVWTNAPPGAYALTVVAMGAVDGLDTSSRTSPPVNITILASTTNANPTDVVNIVATDPIAIAGTNSWIWPGMTNETPAWANWPPASWQSFTNWGPKDALFTVRSFGDASNSITVNYNIGGTASNGVDYVELPGNVTIPAGEAYALIPIVPIDNGSNNFPRTVVLTLTPDTNMPPDYIVGIPPRAAALILENWPRPLPFLLPDGSFHLNAFGPDGAWFSVESSTDLQNWSSISTTNQVFQGSIDFIDPNATNNSSGFYRTEQVTNTPAN
jgi:hypothetical protein